MRKLLFTPSVLTSLRAEHRRGEADRRLIRPGGWPTTAVVSGGAEEAPAIGVGGGGTAGHSW